MIITAFIIPEHGNLFRAPKTSMNRFLTMSFCIFLLFLFLWSVYPLTWISNLVGKCLLPIKKGSVGMFCVELDGGGLSYHSIILNCRIQKSTFLWLSAVKCSLHPKLFFLCLSANSYLWRILGCSVDIHNYIFEPRVAHLKTRILISNCKPLNILCVLHSIHYSDLSI